MALSVQQQNQLAAFNAARNLQGTEATVGAKISSLGASRAPVIDKPAQTADTATVASAQRTQVAAAASKIRVAQEGLSLVGQVKAGLGASKEVLQALTTAFEAATKNGDTPATRLGIANLIGDLDSIGQSGRFGPVGLFNGSVSGSNALEFKVGQGEPIRVDLTGANLVGLAVGFAAGGAGTQRLDTSSPQAIRESLAALSGAQQQVGQALTGMTANGVSFTQALTRLGVEVENLSAAKATSALSSTKMAKDLVGGATSAITSNPAAAFSAQATQNTEALLRLLAD